MKKNHRPTTRDMTVGFIPKLVLQYALPLMIGNAFQMLYNTVDSIVVGNYIGTQALAAVGSTTMIVNMAVFFFNGFSVGASVVIGRYFGAKEIDKLHEAVETTITVTLGFCVLITVLGVAGVRPLLGIMSTPADVLEDASLYLRIYFMGISGVLLYNMGSGILRAVGDTTRPLYYLIFTCVLNIVLDLLFVVVFHAGIAGVAYATVIAQFASAGMVLHLLTTTQDIYHLSWKELSLDRDIFHDIISVGIPTAIQSVVTQFSNVFVQSYINAFGSACMAGWGCFNKVEQFLFLPIQSMAVAATTFVSQNIGAKKAKRADQGTFIIVGLSLVMGVCIGIPIVFAAKYVIKLFTDDPAVISFGILFLQTNTMFALCNCVNQVLAGSLRGMGDSKTPMIILLMNFVVLRQLYLYLLPRFVVSTPQLVGLSYPVGWMGACLAELLYYMIKRRHTVVSSLSEIPV